MYVCIYIYIYVYTCMCVYIYIYIYIHTHIYIYIYMWMYGWIYRSQQYASPTEAVPATRRRPLRGTAAAAVAGHSCSGPQGVGGETKSWRWGWGKQQFTKYNIVLCYPGGCNITYTYSNISYDIVDNLRYCIGLYNKGGVG